MAKNGALIVAGIVFFFIALGHLLRLILGIEITVSGQIVPYWPSYVGLVLAAALSLWMFIASK